MLADASPGKRKFTVGDRVRGTEDAPASLRALDERSPLRPRSWFQFGLVASQVRRILKRASQPWGQPQI